MRGLAAALVVLVAGPGFALGSAPAAGAATCTSSGGVSVVVDYRELGGSTITACAPDGGGKSAAAVFASVGVSLGYATRQPGFVCRVNGAPASDPCVNASPSDAYWGLWWADGSNASWTYSSYGVGSLTVPAGGSVGWSWQQDRTAGSSVPPSVAPPVSRSSTPSPTPSPTPTSSSTPTASPSASPTGGGGAATQPSASSSPSPTQSGGSGGSSGGTGGSGGGGSPTVSPNPGSASPSASPSASSSSTPAAKAALGSESPSDSRRKGEGRKGPLDAESPSDSAASEDDEAAPLGSESPSDSTASDPSPSAGTALDEPQRIPASVTWTIVGLLAIAIAGSAVLARRRRGV